MRFRFLVWLNGKLEEALKLQKPQPDEELVITGYDEKKAASGLPRTAN